MSTSEIYPALTLQIGDSHYSFGSPADLDFALSGRTGLPATKLSSLVELPDKALLQEAESIRKVEQKFSRTLSGRIEDTTNIGVFLLGLDLSIVSHDHQWRDIIAAMNELNTSYDEFKKVALVKYMQYLTSRQEVVRAIYSKRQRDKNSRDSRLFAGDGDVNAQMKETVLFDLTGFQELRKAGEDFDRMPKGETIEIPVSADESIDLLLVKHKYRIVAHEDIRFEDELGHGIVLRSGRNIVGRDAAADITLDATHRDISRKHLIIDTDGTQVIKLTDISSLGTFIPPQYLDKTGT